MAWLELVSGLSQNGLSWYMAHMFEQPLDVCPDSSGVSDRPSSDTRQRSQPLFPMQRFVRKLMVAANSQTRPNKAYKQAAGMPPLRRR